MVDDGQVTTRTLVILRHAKAESPDGLIDRERRLTERGHADAGALGAWLVSHGYAPQLVLCSPARRTRETWQSVATSLPTEAEIWYEEKLYTASVGDLLDTVTDVDDEVQTVLLIGHNPTVSELTATLDPHHAEASGMRTCGLAVHAFDGSWGQCGPGVAPRVAAYLGRS
jgi:phosphohistidine phosphatase